MFYAQYVCNLSSALSVQLGVQVGVTHIEEIDDGSTLLELN